MHQAFARTDASACADSVGARWLVAVSPDKVGPTGRIAHTWGCERCGLIFCAANCRYPRPSSYKKVGVGGAAWPLARRSFSEGGPTRLGSSLLARALSSFSEEGFILARISGSKSGAWVSVCGRLPSVVSSEASAKEEAPYNGAKEGAIRSKNQHSGCYGREKSAVLAGLRLHCARKTTRFATKIL